VNSYFQRVAAYWSDIYEDAGVQELVHQERLQVVLDLIDRVALPTTTTVLDIGCGAGNAAVAIAMKGYGVKAMDAVPAMVEMRRRRALAAGLQNRVRTGLADVSALPFPGPGIRPGNCARGVAMAALDGKAAAGDVSRTSAGGISDRDRRQSLGDSLVPRADDESIVATAKENRPGFDASLD